MYWIIADTHFGHENIKKYCGRPDNFEELIFENLMKIPEGDILIHLGDVAFKGTKEKHEKYIVPLRCKKVLVKGNHDKESDKWFLSHGWDAVYNDAELRITDMKGRIMVLSHDKLPFGVDVEYTYNIFGHIHNAKFTPTDKQIVVSLENEGYKPVTLEYLINKKEKELCKGYVKD